MPNLFRIVVVGGLLAAGIASASSVYAEQSPAPDANGSHMRMDMRHGGMMGMQGGMMERMSSMMESCNNMMQSQNQPPNSQFQKPTQPSQKE